MTRQSNLTCDEILAKMSLFLDGELDDATCGSIHRHAATCDRCRRMIHEFELATGLCRTAARKPLPDDVCLRARERVRTLLAAARKPPQRARVRTSATGKKRASKT
jgi:anti-sigma factor RsiW